MTITIELEFQTGYQTGIRLGIRLVSDWYQTGHRRLLKLTTSKLKSPAAAPARSPGRPGNEEKEYRLPMRRDDSEKQAEEADNHQPSKAANRKPHTHTHMPGLQL